MQALSRHYTITTKGQVDRQRDAAGAGMRKAANIGYIDADIALLEKPLALVGDDRGLFSTQGLRCRSRGDFTEAADRVAFIRPVDSTRLLAYITLFPPESRGKQNQQGEYLQSAEQHRKAQNPLGRIVDRSKILANLTQAGAEVVETGRNR